MGQKFVIYSNAVLDEAALSLLCEETKEYRLLTGSDDCLEADIAFGQPEVAQVIASKRLRWMHITSAGYTRYDTDEMRVALREKGAFFTNSSHVYDAPCAQHLLAMMMADARQLLPCHEDQRTARDWPTKARRQASYLLNEQTVLLLGMGAIAQYLVRLLEPFEMEIIALRKSGRQHPGIEVISEEELEAALPRADHVVNLLPENPSTVGLMDGLRFGRMKHGARFYNIGRGKTVEQNALSDALKSGRVGAAYLDVTDPEPLPPIHPLWNAPNCFITPHSAGGHRGERLRLVKHFVKNLRAFEADKPLEGRIWADLPPIPERQEG